MKYPEPFPIVGSIDQTRELSFELPYPDSIPEIQKFISKTSLKVKGADQDYALAVDFLSTHARVSSQTFNAFRTEVERLLLWSWLIHEKSLAEINVKDLNKYMDFCMRPLTSWVAFHQSRHFLSIGKKSKKDEEDKVVEYKPNPNWKPFKVPEGSFGRKAVTVKRAPSKNSLDRQFSAMSSFYDHLVEHYYVIGNPIKLVKKQSPYVYDDLEPPTIKRFGEDDWKLVLSILTEKANSDKNFERNLFAVVALKSLYLRVSELASRPNWIPVMSHFYKDEYNNCWLKVFGKGRKLRTVSVPDKFLEYLARYRESRGLSDFPLSSEEEPIIQSTSIATEGLSIRQMTRLIEKAFEVVALELVTQGEDKKARLIQSASSHWLRHTGASIDIQTRPIKHISDDLGHRTMETTDRNYIQSTYRERAKTGAKRDV